jgi:hypothetical protein
VPGQRAVLPPGDFLEKRERARAVPGKLSDQRGADNGVSVVEQRAEGALQGSAP